MLRHFISFNTVEQKPDLENDKFNNNNNGVLTSMKDWFMNTSNINEV